MKNRIPLVDLDFFNGFIESLKELGESEEIKTSNILYPKLSQGIADREQLEEFSRDYYSSISHIDYDFMIENCYKENDIKGYLEDNKKR